MNRMKAFAFGLLIALTVGAFAQDSVIPSRLKLQALRVGAGTVPAAGNITATGTVTATTHAGAHTGDGSALTNLSAANLTGTLPAISGANLTSLNAGNISTGTLAVARGGTGVTTSTGTGSVVLSTSPALTTPTVGGQQVCRADGVNCPAQNTNIMAAAVISGIGTCSVSTGALRVSSCTRAAAGSYQVNFSQSIGANNPACVVTVNNNAATQGIPSVQTFNATRKDVRIAVAGTLTDANFEILCVAT